MSRIFETELHPNVIEGEPEYYLGIRAAIREVFGSLLKGLPLIDDYSKTDFRTFLGGLIKDVDSFSKALGGGG